jgi:hypothetical protein
MSEHLCITCAVRGRKPVHYEQAHVCPNCRGWLAVLPADIVTLWVRLDSYHTIEPDSPYQVRQLYKGHWVTKPGYDPVSSALPAVAAGSQLSTDMVSGSRETAVPANLDLVDLTLPVHGDHLTDHGRLWWEDQIGHVSVAQELDLLVREWAEDLSIRWLPAPTVPVLANWLADRMSWACDHHPGVDHAATQLYQLRGTLRVLLGDVTPRPEKMGAPCPSCDMKTLFRFPGEDRIDCTGEDCRRVLTADEYERWSRMVVADVCMT